MKQALYFRKLSDIYELIQWGGFQGSYEDFLALNIGEVMIYVRIAYSVLEALELGQVQ